MTYEFLAEIWLYDAAKGSWCFVTLPKDISEEIKENFGKGRPGWGSIPVDVTAQELPWKTSIFPDKKRGVYLLPIKMQVRKELDAHPGDTITIRVKVLIW